MCFKHKHKIDDVLFRYNKDTLQRADDFNANFGQSNKMVPNAVNGLSANVRDFARNVNLCTGNLMAVIQNVVNELTEAIGKIPTDFRYLLQIFMGRKV